MNFSLNSSQTAHLMQMTAQFDLNFILFIKTDRLKRDRLFRGPSTFILLDRPFWTETKQPFIFSDLFSEEVDKCDYKLNKKEYGCIYFEKQSLDEYYACNVQNVDRRVIQNYSI